MQPWLNPGSAESQCAVRPPEPGDYASMADLAGQLGYPCTADEIRTRLTAMQSSPQHAVYVAELPPGQIVGWIGLYLLRSVAEESCAQISGLIVDQQIRCHEIGKVLLNTAEEWARSHGCDAISVHSNVTRERAHRFYTRHGYEHVKTQKYLRKLL